MKHILRLLSGIILLSIAGCNFFKPAPGYMYYVGEARSRFY